MPTTLGVMLGSGRALTGLQPAHRPMVISSSATVLIMAFLLLWPECDSDGGSGEHDGEVDGERGEGVGHHQSGQWSSSHRVLTAA